MANKKPKPEQQELYDYIDELVLRFQNGDEYAGEELLEMFGALPYPEPRLYIGKYYQLLRFGKISWDRDMRMFMSLLIEDPEVRASLKKPYQYSEDKKKIARAVHQFVENASFIEPEDLIQDLIFLFLRQVKRYEKKNRNFNAYLYNSYRYAVYNHLHQMMKRKEPYHHFHDSLLSYEEDLHGEDVPFHVEEDVFEEVFLIFDGEELGNNWIRGITCGEEFIGLTPLERLILKMHYADKVSDHQIAKDTGMHVNTIFKKRSKAREKVISKVEEMIREGYYD